MQCSIDGSTESPNVPHISTVLGLDNELLETGSVSETNFHSKTKFSVFEGLLCISPICKTILSLLDSCIGVIRPDVRCPSKLEVLKMGITSLT